MTKKTASKREPAGAPRNTPGRSLLLTLTLVPLVIGVILIGAWVLDIGMFDDPQVQVTVGVLFFLLGFTLSNLLQGRWLLAAGWGLLMCADIIILVWLHVWAQSAAAVVGLTGFIFLGIEFYRQYQLKRAENVRKRR